MSTCATCGHTWATGSDGSHSCVARLLAERDELRAQVLRLTHQASDMSEQIRELSVRNMRPAGFGYVPGVVIR